MKIDLHYLGFLFIYGGKNILKIPKIQYIGGSGTYSYNFAEQSNYYSHYWKILSKRLPVTFVQMNVDM